MYIPEAFLESLGSTIAVCSHTRRQRLSSTQWGNSVLLQTFNLGRATIHPSSSAAQYSKPQLTAFMKRMLPKVECHLCTAQSPHIHLHYVLSLVLNFTNLKDMGVMSD